MGCRCPTIGMFFFILCASPSIDGLTSGGRGAEGWLDATRHSTCARGAIILVIHDELNDGAVG